MLFILNIILASVISQSRTYEFEMENLHFEKERCLFEQNDPIKILIKSQLVKYDCISRRKKHFLHWIEHIQRANDEKNSNILIKNYHWNNKQTEMLNK